MLILALESSALSASAALCADGDIIAETWQRTGLTHSETLLPMTENLLKTAGKSLSDVDLFAAAVGPGSFTGLRIGAAAVKGLAYALSRPCAGISSLEALFFAHAAYPAGSAVVCVMDARVGQVYAAAFDADTGERLMPDRAITTDTLAEELARLEKPLWLTGDGAALAYEAWKDRLPVTLAPDCDRWQHARGVARAAAALSPEAYVTASALRPEYHRLPQAERERLARLAGKTDQ